MHKIVKMDSFTSMNKSIFEESKYWYLELGQLSEIYKTFSNNTINRKYYHEKKLTFLTKLLRRSSIFLTTVNILRILFEPKTIISILLSFNFSLV